MKIRYIFLFLAVITLSAITILSVHQKFSQKYANNSYIVNSTTLMLTAPTVNSAPIYYLPKGKIVECEYNNNGFSMCSWKFSNSDEPIIGWTALKDLAKK